MNNKTKIRIKMTINAERFKLLNLREHRHLLDDLAKLYIQVFLEAPYFEKYEFEEVCKEFTIYSKYHTILIIYDEKVSGFIFLKSGSELNKPTEIKDALQKYINLENSVYIDEFAICNNYRGQGVGSKIMEIILEQYKSYDLFLRTNLVNNNSVLKFYKKFNFEITPITEIVETESAITQTKQMDTRVYMVKKTNN